MNLNKLNCDVSRCTGDKCELKQYCARYTAPVNECVSVSTFEAKYCILQDNIEFISNGKEMKKEIG